MPLCFVIQPFDNGKFDRRYDEIFEPAINAAGFTPYRVDKDPSVDVPIETIEERISSADAVLAEITLDNPNVWYELGFAFALRRPITMICSDERISKYPFDIQHRTVIRYVTDSIGGFQDLGMKITARLETVLQRSATLEELGKHEAVATIEGLSQVELVVLGVFGSSGLGEVITHWSAKNDVEKAGFTAIGFNVGLKRLINKGFIAPKDGYDGYNDPYEGYALTDGGWGWIDTHEDLFATKSPYVKRVADTPVSEDDDIPF